MNIQQLPAYMKWLLQMAIAYIDNETCLGECGKPGEQDYDFFIEAQRQLELIERDENSIELLERSEK